MNKRIYVVSYPRSGNSWVRSVLFYLSSPDSDDIDEVMDKREVNQGAWLGAFRNNAFQKVIHKSHACYEKPLFQAKNIIYLYRNPIDVANSWYKMWILRKYKKSFDYWLDHVFLNRMYRLWDYHVKSWLMSDAMELQKFIDMRRSRRLGKFLSISYENMQENFMFEIKKILGFLGWDYSDKEIEQAQKRLSHINRLFKKRYEFNKMELNYLETRHRQRIINNFGDTMKILGYL